MIDFRKAFCYYKNLEMCKCIEVREVWEGMGWFFGEAMGMEGGLRQDDMFSCFKDK